MLVTQQDIEDYAIDGVVCLRQVIAPEWITKLRAGIDKNIEQPTDRGRLWNRADDGSTTFYDSQAWTEIEEYRDFVLHSPMAGLAGHTQPADKFAKVVRAPSGCRCHEAT